MAEDLLGERKARLGRHFALGADFLEHARVVDRVDDHGHRLVVLGRRTDHRGAADVDVFNGKLKGAVRTRDRLLERIEVHADDVDRVDAVVGDGLHVLGHRAAREDAGVNVRIKRLDAAVEHLGEARVVGHFLAGDAFLGEKLGGAARREDVVAQLDEAARELNHAGLVGDADQSLFLHGSNFLIKNPRSEARADEASCAGCFG